MWLSGEERLHDTSLALARMADDAPALARTLREWVRDDLAPDLGASFSADILGWALEVVDWHAIARGLIEEAEK